VNGYRRILGIAAVCKAFSLPWEHQWLIVQFVQGHQFSSDYATTEAALSWQHLLSAHRSHTTFGLLVHFDGIGWMCGRDSQAMPACIAVM
jgi:hypothetical protein